MTTEATRTDTLSPEERSARMARVRSKDTKPELRVRRFLHASGLRYRLQTRIETARPDLVFPSRRTVVFVHGCIWHRHPDPACPLTRTPKSRIDFWTTKFAGNVARDQRQCATLEAAGWRVLVIWECQTTHPAHLDALRRAIQAGAVQAGVEQTGVVRTGSVQTGAIQTGVVQAEAVRTGSVQTGAIQTGAIQTGAIQTGAIHRND